MPARAAGGGALTLILAAAALAVAAPKHADAAVSCSFLAGELIVVMSEPLDVAQLERAGSEVRVSRDGGNPIGCAGLTPTVLTTERIRVQGSPAGSTGLVLDLGGGPLAPGLAPELGGVPEIEIEVSLPDGDPLDPELVQVAGTEGVDTIALGEAGGGNGINLNAAPESAATADADLSFPDNAPPIVEGRQGADLISAAGGRGFSSALQGTVPLLIGGDGADRLIGGDLASLLAGAGGDDRLRGGRSHDDLEGGRGRDRLTGLGGQDRLYGGRGRDLFRAGAGRDQLFARDRRRESVNCGPGRDLARTDRRDRRKRCELVERG